MRDAIRRVFLDVWDPIGIADEPNAQDEYDSYIEPVYQLLMRSASDEEIATYLLWVVFEQMGLSGIRASMRAHQELVVKALRLIPLTHA